MSKLNQLIQELCPNGVEHKPLGEISNIARGASPRPIKNFLTTDLNGVNWIKIGDVHPGAKYITQTEERITRTGAEKSRIVKKGDFILSNSMSFGRPYILKIDGCIHDGWLSISDFSKFITADYLYYTLLSTPIQNEMAKCASFGGAVRNLNADIVRNITIPVPPLEVQQEIVRILDSFTELIEKLKVELTARKRQFEHYRDKLLTGNSDFVNVKLGDICTVITKGTTPKYYTQNGISFIKTESFEGTRILPERLSYIDEFTHTTFLKRSILQENDILITIAGATIGKCAMVSKELLPANTNQALAIIRLKEGNSSRFIMYILQSKLMKKYISKNIKGSAQPNLNLQQLNDFIVPLPPLEKQESIVNTLTHFDCLCNDLSDGLPAEIEARQKQYEYYRDKLLSFSFLHT